MHLLDIPERWVSVYRKCPVINQKDPLQLSSEEIKEELNKLLFNPPKELNATDKELLTIIIRRDKAGLFDFLKAFTKWKVVGLWESQEEKNLQIDIEFKDNREECIGNRILHLLYAYNKKIVGEEILYARTVPIEEGTL